MWHPLTKQFSKSTFLNKGANSARGAKPELTQTQKFMKRVPIHTTTNSLSRDKDSSSIDKKMRDQRQVFHKSSLSHTSTTNLLKTQSMIVGNAKGGLMTSRSRFF